MRVWVVIGCFLFLSVPGTLGAQHLPQSSFVQAERPAATLALGGAGGFGAGVVAGGALGGALGIILIQCDDQDGCWGDYVNWAFNGAAAGSSALIPLGVHLANRRQGRLAPALLASAGVGAVGLGTFWVVQRAEGPDALMFASVVATPALQILSSVAIERFTSRRGR